MKIAVIYYTLTGSTGYVADIIARETGADKIRINTKKKLPDNFFKYLKGGFQSFFKVKPELEELEKDFSVNNYDLLFIGTPVWADKYTPAIGSFITEHNFNNKKVVLFACGRDVESTDKALSSLRKDIKNVIVTGEKAFVEPIKGKNETRRTAEGWSRELVKNLQ